MDRLTFAHLAIETQLSTCFIRISNAFSTALISTMLVMMACHASTLALFAHKTFNQMLLK